MTCEIISVGTELLLGQIVNTNAQYIATRLAELGIGQYFQTTVGDNPDRLREALRIASGRAELIITTGGLGPTEDDLTKEICVEFLGKHSVLHIESANRILERFRNMGVEHPTENNLKQAFFPEDAIVLPNDNGTAPGAILEEGKLRIVVLPGPPFEMKLMFNSYVMPYLEQYTGKKLTSRVLKVIGVGESSAAKRLGSLLDSKNPTVAPLASRSECTFRITALTDKAGDPWRLIEPIEQQIRAELGSAVYGIDNQTLASVVIDMLRERHATVATAESCTGGLIGDMLTDVSGASDVYREGFITYSNEIKTKHLGVRPETLAEHTEYSPECAREMAEGLLAHTDADYAISVTGIAGPTGGTPEKPVGTAYIGYGCRGDVRVLECHTAGDREKVKEGTAKKALNALRLFMIEETGR